MNNLTSDSATKASGRFSRRSYLAWNMLIGLIFMVIGIVVALVLPGAQNALNEGAMSMPFLIIFGILYIVAIYYSIVFLIRRLHDRDHSGWLALLIIVPFLNILFALYVLLAPGNTGSNQFGQPRPTRGWETVFAVLYILVFVIGMLAAIMIPSYQNYVERAQQATLEQQ